MDTNDNVVNLADFSEDIAMQITHHEINLIVETALLADCLRLDGVLSKRDYDAIEKTVTDAASRAICEAKDPIAAMKYFLAVCGLTKQAVQEATKQCPN